MIWLPAVIVPPYFFLFLWIFIKLRKARPSDIKVSGKTSATVIIACRNEEQNIPGLLMDLTGQDYPCGLFEVIVVDDNSNDRTSEFVSRDASGLDLKLMRNNGAGKKEAIRTGVMNSSSDFIITTDADCRLGKSWLRTIVSCYETLKPDIIIGPVISEGGKGFTGRFGELEFLGLQAITAGTALAGHATMCNGANLAFSKKAYLKHSENLHFEINSGDDIFLLHSIKKQSGAKIAWLESGDAIVRTESEKGIRAFLSQRKRWISKSTRYNDNFTILLGIVTFVTISAQGIFMLASIINLSFIIPFLSMVAMKSVPDLLLIRSASVRYKRRASLAWFIPAQLVYPLYVCVLLIWPGKTGDKRN